ncbi:Cytosolic Fe S cluster assembly factor NUBP2 [Paragonimus heterotremus]|uniref:Cytosolic Fe S cluster assembly factor NUBP2 n=1 Tax=Paragonimus heterotremus TaxID=100268 RepID=A0A8J4SNM8_9TREM|nr:Cytosolic Fe S cluster assembly factor NUBP2 [Paragonimus heterotremus]
MKRGLCDTSNVLVVVSGKGGVGKSTVAAQLAVGMWMKGMRIGLLDTDFCGPSIPRILGLSGCKIHACPEGWTPVYADGPSQRLRVMSIGFLLNDEETAVVWRGPRKSGMIEELLNSVCWGQLDCLIIDTPPGTSDEHLSILAQIQQLPQDKLAGAVVVSTPQRVSLCDVRRELSFCEKSNLKVVGLIENMSGYRCPSCAHCTNLFSSGGAEALATERNVPFLGRLPLDPTLTSLCDSSDLFPAKARTTEATMSVVDAIFNRCPTLAVQS